jgi:hypothetical protein
VPDAGETPSAPLQSRPESEPPTLEPRRRNEGEDLISEIFDELHELTYLTDIAQGSDFVMAIIRAILPSEAVTIHVFDIDSSNFVVVRASPAVPDVLLLRMPDDDPLLRDVMARQGCARFDHAADDLRFESKLWTVLGVTPRQVLVGPVKHGGRYLGLIQVVNPSGGTPFHDAEANALEYLCKRFADFIASRPVVLEADTVIPPA